MMLKASSSPKQELADRGGSCNQRGSTKRCPLTPDGFTPEDQWDKKFKIEVVCVPAEMALGPKVSPEACNQARACGRPRRPTDGRGQRSKEETRREMGIPNVLASAGRRTCCAWHEGLGTPRMLAYSNQALDGQRTSHSRAHGKTSSPRTTHRASFQRLARSGCRLLSRRRIRRLQLGALLPRPVADRATPERGRTVRGSRAMVPAPLRSSARPSSRRSGRRPYQTFPLRAR